MKNATEAAGRLSLSLNGLATDLDTGHGGTMRTSGTGREGRTAEPLACSYETARTGRDSDRLAHNPEVAGSNAVPATSKKRPSENSPLAVFTPLLHLEL